MAGDEPGGCVSIAGIDVEALAPPRLVSWNRNPPSLVRISFLSFLSLLRFVSCVQLVFNPHRRIGVVEALEHPYLADLHAQVRRGTVGRTWRSVPVPEIKRRSYKM